MTEPDPMVTELVHMCDLCGGKDFECPDGINRFFQTEPDNEIVRCRSCGFLFRAGMPDKSSDSDICATKGIRFGEYTGGTVTVNRRLVDRLAFFTKRIKGKKRLLDVGCGTGSFVDWAQKADWEVFGTETSDSESENIITVDIATESHPDLIEETFSLVHLNHVLEHVVSPVRLMQAAARYASPGGFLCIEVPNEVFSLATRIKMMIGVKSNSATAYFGHRCFFNKQTLRLLVEKAGLQVIRVKTPYVGHDLGAIHRIFDYFQSLIGMGAVIEIIARKNGR